MPTYSQSTIDTLEGYITTANNALIAANAPGATPARSR